LYGDQLARRRKRLHQRVGAILEASAAMRRGREAALAYHLAAVCPTHVMLLLSESLAKTGLSSELRLRWAMHHVRGDSLRTHHAASGWGRCEGRDDGRHVDTWPAQADTVTGPGLF